ncbi:MADS-box transcription factor [Vigna unguiculata]|uniref:MADS-box transcription factor n=1 Tax=Vigna unguiculata TaxID=3917 RepID=A0A4D6M4U8_VIGUN|nr:MADS-box transcription factor [Vigna unguiculata]
MGRARVTLKPIPNQRCRKTTFLRRKMGLVKKVSEFCIMCQAKACLIVYDDDSDKIGPEIWPQDSAEVQSLIQNYVCQTEKSPKTFQIQDFFDNRKNMIEAEISKLHKQERDIMYPTWDPSLNNMDKEQLWAFVADVNAKIGACDQRITMLKNKNDQDREISIDVMNNMSHQQQQQQKQSVSSQLSFMCQKNQQQQLMSMSLETLLSVDEKYDGVPLDSTFQVGGVSGQGINMLRNIEQDGAYFCYMPNMVHESATSSQPRPISFMQNKSRVGVPPNSSDQFDESLEWFNQFNDFEWLKESNGTKDLSNSVFGNFVDWTSEPHFSTLQLQQKIHDVQSQNEQQEQEVDLAPLPPSLF